MYMTYLDLKLNFNCTPKRPMFFNQSKFWKISEGEMLVRVLSTIFHQIFSNLLQKIFCNFDLSFASLCFG